MRVHRERKSKRDRGREREITRETNIVTVVLPP